MNGELKARLKQRLVRSIRAFFERKSAQRRTQKNQLDVLFPVEHRIRSLIGGLETSMGTIVWEEFAKELAANNGFEVVSDPLLEPSPLPAELKAAIESICNTRAQGEALPTTRCLEIIQTALTQVNLQDLEFVPPRKSGYGVDVHLRKAGKEYLFDLKSGQPNVGDIPRYCRQLVEWYAYALARNPSANIEARIAFTFNPFKRSWYAEQKGKLSTHLDPDADIMVENEFWDFCSGYCNTSGYFDELFQELRDEGFDREFHDIFYPQPHS